MFEIYYWTLFFLNIVFVYFGTPAYFINNISHWASSSLFVSSFIFWLVLNAFWVLTTGSMISRVVLLISFLINLSSYTQVVKSGTNDFRKFISVSELQIIFLLFISSFYFSSSWFWLGGDYKKGSSNNGILNRVDSFLWGL